MPAGFPARRSSFKTKARLFLLNGIFGKSKDRRKLRKRVRKLSIRIYALAKQLKKESKELVDVCKQLGFDGKASPLASLTDEEAKMVVDRLSQNAASAPSSRSFLETAETEPMRKPPILSAPSGKVPVLTPARPARLAELSSRSTVVKNESVEPAPKVETSEPVVEKVESAPETVAPAVEPTPVVETAATSVVETPSEIVDAPKETVPTVEESVVSEPEKTTPIESVESVANEEKTVEPESEPVAPQAEPPRRPNVAEKKSPLRDAIDRRDPRRRDKDGARRDAKPNDSRPTPPRAVPPIPSIFTEQDSRDKILEEMKRPPMITPPRGDRVRVVEMPRRPKKDESAASSRPGGSSAPRPSVAIHLAPLPTPAAKPIKKATNEPAPQKPEMRLPPEALRAAARGVSRPLTEHIREQEERRRQGDAVAKGRDAKDKNARRAPLGSGFGTGAGFGAKDGASSGGDSKFGRGDDRKNRFGASGKSGGYGDSGSDFGASGKRSKKSSKDRGEGEGRDDARARRRGGNDLKRGRGDDDFGSDYRYSSRSPRRKDKSSASVVTAPRKSEVAIETPCTVKQFAEATGVSVASVIKKLMELGYMFTLNHSLDAEIVELLIVAFELKATVKQEATLEEQYVDAAFDQVDPEESLVPRAPVVTFLGHVDHGKTSLLDRILHLHVVSSESGGITQHIRAYRVETPGGPVTFVDTPGHEAFTEMRARGANCTDIAVLVVAADDGVMPQTEEAISHAKAAGVPIVVALNKMDLPGVNRDKVIQELASNDLMPSEWGGDVEIIETSAMTGAGVDQLLETLLTVAELNELKANPTRHATGVVLEASLQSGEGVVCKALVQKGTLRPGDVVLCGAAYGRVRAMTDTLDARKKIKEAGPSMPVSLVGLDVAPAAGSKFVVLDDISVARQIAEERSKQAREAELADVQSHVTLENLFERMNSAKQQTLNVIIRADVRGSIEAIRKEMGKLEHPEVKVKILQASVGGVTEADVHLADASDAIIVGFNVVPDEGARSLAEKKKIQVRRYDVIYKLTEDIRAALEGMLKPIEQVKELGRALVQRAFNISRVGTIAGCRVLYGVVERDCKVRVIRDSRIIGEYHLETLKREKDDVKEVREGYECGIKLKNFNDVKEGDVLEAYKIEEVARTF